MYKRARNSVHKPLRDLSNRELGHLPARIFPNRLAASEDLVLRLDVFKKLDKHRGCVNTVCFNADGDILLSGSDDRRIILWDWETGRVKLSFHSGHSNNVFQAKFMSHSYDRSIVTCAADGQARHAQLLEDGHVETKLLGKHQGRAHKLAIEPGSPHIFYTCGEDGLVQHFDLRTGTATELFTCKPLKDSWNYMPVIHLNAIAIDPRNPNLFAVAGSDEYTRLFDIRKYKWDASTDFGQPTDYFCPPHLIGDERVGITGLAFSEQRELLVSYNDEFIYLFTQDMGLGLDPVPGSPISVDSDTSEAGGSHGSARSPSNTDADVKIAPQVFKGHRNCETVKGVNFFGPNCEYVVSGSDCGRIFTWKKKGGELIRVMEADKHVVNCIESHPHSTVLASSGIEHDIKIWTPKALEKATLPKNIEQVVIFDEIHWFESDDDEDDSDDHDNFIDEMFDDDDDDDMCDGDMFDDDDDIDDDNEDEDDDEGCDDEEDDDDIDECDEGDVNDCNNDDNDGVGDDNNDDNGKDDNFSGGL
ncbi:transducin/WD-like repeat-protein [Medicago truncatula]|uniref:Transducin/WD-like repeat-protein n=2 Tax=Medicago truncatula TaxID=3880 RepID=A0A072VRW7_MEDTR|nr:transducin/WD-like repeat-protein [Medicago truncatula]